MSFEPVTEAVREAEAVVGVSALVELGPAELGHAMHELMADLFPICRSITGAGLRETLARIGTIVPLTLTEVPTGTQAFDWTVPRPDHPTWVPYRTSYYADSSGFCLSQDSLDRLPDGEYEAVIDATLDDGSLTYGECVLHGTSDEEVLILSHVCHPPLANDNLSGVVVAAYLASMLSRAQRWYTYRFLFAPGTIGAIVWLSRNETRPRQIRAGLVLACVGDSGPVVYKRSRRGDATIDRAAAHVLGARAGSDEVIDFSPYGNDERQFCSPGFDLPVGAITRSGHDRSERHHTSADGLSSIDPGALADTLGVCLSILGILERDATLFSLNPKGEPQLGRRGLYRAFGGRAEQAALESALLWTMSLADGAHTALDVAEQSGLPFAVVDEAAGALEAAQLLRREPVIGARRGVRG